MRALCHFARIALLVTCLLTAPAAVTGQTNDADSPSPRAATSPSIQPIGAWQFESSDALSLGRIEGRVDLEQTGPRPPRYPSFPEANRAALFDGKGAAWRVLDTSDNSPWRFGQGDSLTLEAWVRVQALGDGQLAYIIGKGRSRKADWADKNQNYALRLKGEKDQALVSFLFSSVAEKEKPSEWHRWTSKSGFSLGGGWHHVAVTYTFGQPNSIRGYVDGRVVDGSWDMGGATTRPPVQDNDDLVLGTGNGGGEGNSFHGWLDDVRIWRAALPEATLTGRFVYVAPAPTVIRRELPRGLVQVELCEEGVPEANAWPVEPPSVTERYTEDCFGFFEVPQKYTATGVRADRPIPYLFRAAAEVTLPAGTHRILLRGRGAARLYYDDKLLVSTPFPPNTSDGHHAIPKDYLDLGPTFRFAPPGNREAWCEIKSDGQPHLFVLETLVGSLVGKAKRRPELGETVVAISLEATDSWQLLSPETHVPYDDSGWSEYESLKRRELAQINAQRRADQRLRHADYWQRRRAAAAAWLASTPEIPVPALPTGYAAHNPIDHFLAARLSVATQEARRTQAEGVDFHREIRPLLESRCFDCHQGLAVQGGLRLDSRKAALAGGESVQPAIVPGASDKSILLRRVSSHDASERMPPKGEPLSAAQVAAIKRWIDVGAPWPEVSFDHLECTSLTNDLAFLRRVTLDTVGVPPTLDEIRAFEASTAPNRRAAVIKRLLNDPRWADHWVGYWQDVLAENPNILNPTLNNSGPFRWWIHESLEDNKPLDLFVTELVRMEGSIRFGGPAGFGVASQNDVPLAAKGTVLATAFLGVELKCARCHDAPNHTWLQRDLFQLAALMAKQPVEVPTTSSVPLDKLHQGGRRALIRVTLDPGTKVEPQWPFTELCDPAIADQLAETPSDSRDRLAALITAPQNERFAQVIANRVWRRLFGRGLVEPVDDWQRATSTHPELVRWLGRELVRANYDVKRLVALILNSHAYQRATDPTQRTQHPLFAAPAPRRMTAEQVVDSLFSAMGKEFQTEEVNLDVDSQRDLGNSISLGRPHRAWMFTSTSNERDRPSLSLPRVQAMVDVLAAFGWRPARPDPQTVRDEAPNILQPAVLANGPVSVWLTRLSDDHGMTQLALQRELPLDELIDALFLKLLTRRPTADERARYLDHLEPGFSTRLAIAPGDAARVTVPRQPPRYVSWSNHLTEEANEIKIELEAAARRGDPPTRQLTDAWRQRFEDVLWAMLNAPEWVYLP